MSVGAFRFARKRSGWGPVHGEFNRSCGLSTQTSQHVSEGETPSSNGHGICRGCRRLQSVCGRTGSRGGQTRGTTRFATWNGTACGLDHARAAASTAAAAGHRQRTQRGSEVHLEMLACSRLMGRFGSQLSRIAARPPRRAMDVPHDATTAAPGSGRRCVARAAAAETRGVALERRSERWADRCFAIVQVTQRRRDTAERRLHAVGTVAERVPQSSPSFHGKLRRFVHFHDDYA